MNQMNAIRERLAFSIRLQLPAKYSSLLFDWWFDSGWWTRNDGYLFFDDRIFELRDSQVEYKSSCYYIVAILRVSASSSHTLETDEIEHTSFFIRATEKFANKSKCRSPIRMRIRSGTKRRGEWGKRASIKFIIQYTYIGK